MRHIEENEWCDSLNMDKSIIVFSGMAGLFDPILDHRKAVYTELLRMSRPDHFMGLSKDFSHSITVHVRLGDFQPFNDVKLRSGVFNVQLPMQWIIESILHLRDVLGKDYPVWVFSDGNNEDLNDLLTLSNVTRLHFGSALADMLAMSKSCALIVSSTFSMWSAYLGSVPSIYYPGQLRQRLIPEGDGWEIEREWGTHYSQDFLDLIVR